MWHNDQPFFMKEMPFDQKNINELNNPSQFKCLVLNDTMFDDEERV